MSGFETMIFLILFVMLIVGVPYLILLWSIPKSKSKERATSDRAILADVRLSRRSGSGSR